MRTPRPSNTLVLAGAVVLVAGGCAAGRRPIAVNVVVADAPPAFAFAGAGPARGAASAPMAAHPTTTTPTTTTPKTTAPAPPGAPATGGPALAPFTQDLPGTALSFEMLPVPGDGDVAPFWMARTETTWDLYDVFVFELDKKDDGAGGSSSGQPEADAVTRPSRPYVAPDLGFGHAGYAAISVAYKGADQYCRWLSAKTGRRYRLPTEAEWKLACAQGGVTRETMDDHAWHEGNADFTPHPVATKEPDALGLHDMWGNVREWCAGADGPVALGGSYDDPADAVGCDARAVPTPAWQMTDPQVPKSVWWLSDAGFMGFRVICVPGGETEGATE